MQYIHIVFGIICEKLGLHMRKKKVLKENVHVLYCDDTEYYADTVFVYSKTIYEAGTIPIGVAELIGKTQSQKIVLRI